MPPLSRPIGSQHGTTGVRVWSATLPRIPLPTCPPRVCRPIRRPRAGTVFAIDGIQRLCETGVVEGRLQSFQRHVVVGVNEIDEHDSDANPSAAGSDLFADDSLGGFADADGSSVGSTGLAQPPIMWQSSTRGPLLVTIT